MKTTLLLAILFFFVGNVNAQPWYQIPTGTNKKLNTISFPSPTVGYIGGNDSLLLKSIDGGQTWNEINYTGVIFIGNEDSILNLKFVTETIGFMATGPYGGIYKTINGGLVWSQLTPAGVLCFNEGLFFFDENNGFLGGSGCFIGETIEKMAGGVLATTTISTPTNTAQNMVVDIDFLNSNFGLAASYSGYILRTTNGGLNWDTIPSGLTSGIPLTSVAIVDDTLAYAGYNELGGGFGILRSTDAGLTWNEDINSATFYYPAFYSVHVSGNGNVYSGAQPSWGTTGLIFESTGANLWNYYEVDQPIFDMASYNNSTVFGVGDSGYVVVNQIPANLGISKLPEENNALVVYPNPVSEIMTIQIPLELGSPNFTIELLNVTGELVYSNLNNAMTIDLSNLPSGIYFVQVLSETESYSTRIVKN